MFPQRCPPIGCYSYTRLLAQDGSFTFCLRRRSNRTSRREVRVPRFLPGKIVQTASVSQRGVNARLSRLRFYAGLSPTTRQPKCQTAWAGGLLNGPNRTNLRTKSSGAKHDTRLSIAINVLTKGTVAFRRKLACWVWAPTSLRRLVGVSRFQGPALPRCQAGCLKKSVCGWCG